MMKCYKYNFGEELPNFTKEFVNSGCANDNYSDILKFANPFYSFSYLSYTC